MKTFLLVLLVSVAAFGGEVSPDEEHAMTSYAWKLPSILSLPRIERVLNRLAARTYGKGFRYLGEFNDFDHGHVIYEIKQTADGHRLIPRAILYHMQEQAYQAHWDADADKKYDYLNVQTRNWLQWLDDDEARDGVKIENALKYLDWATKEGKVYALGSEPKQSSHYSIGSRSLDAKQLGFAVYGESQFEFHVSGCESFEDLFARGPIRVTLPDEDRTDVCLRLTTLSGFTVIPHQ